MMVASSLDLWRKDALFSAAEEVQESADVMESTYRMWARQKREGTKAEDLDELSRELQTALGTAKWQLEEFERAVRLSHDHCCDDITSLRHKQFIAAIGSQISHVEVAFRESFSEEGKQPLQWVNLNKEECEDLAMFLSGFSQILQIVKDDCTAPVATKKDTFREKILRRKDGDFKLNGSLSTDIFGEQGSHDTASNKSCKTIMDIKGQEVTAKRDDTNYQADKTIGTRRMCSSQNFGALKITIADEDEQKNKLLPRIEATPKEKGFKPPFWKLRRGEHSQTNTGKNAFNQAGGLQRHLQAPLHRQFSCSIQLTLALMISIFLIAAIEAKSVEMLMAMSLTILPAVLCPGP